jgi:hypothetical protein
MHTPFFVLQNHGCSPSFAMSLQSALVLQVFVQKAESFAVKQVGVLSEQGVDLKFNIGSWCSSNEQPHPPTSSPPFGLDLYSRALQPKA